MSIALLEGGADPTLRDDRQDDALTCAFEPGMSEWQCQRIGSVVAMLPEMLVHGLRQQTKHVDCPTWTWRPPFRRGS